MNWSVLNGLKKLWVLLILSGTLTAHAQDNQQLLDSCYYSFFHRDYNELRRFSEAAITHYSAVDHASNDISAQLVRAQAFKGLALICSYDDIQGGVGLLESLLPTIKQLPDSRILLGDAYFFLSIGRLFIGDLGVALQHMHLADEIYKANLDRQPLLYPENTQNMGYVSFQNDEYTTAIEYYEQSITQRGQVQPIAIARLRNIAAYNNIALVYREEGDYNTALQMQYRVMFEKRKIYAPEHDEMIVAHVNLGLMLNEMGQYEAASHHYREAYKLGKDHPNVYLRIAVTNNMGQVHIYEGEYQQALSKYEETLRMEQSVDTEKNELAVTMHNIGYSHLYLKNWAEADRYITQALNTGDPSHTHKVIFNISKGVLYTKQERYAEAEAYLKAAVQLNDANDYGRHNEVIEANYFLSDIAKAQGASVAAFDYNEQALTRSAYISPNDFATTTSDYMMYLVLQQRGSLLYEQYQQTNQQNNTEVLKNAAHYLDDAIEIATLFRHSVIEPQDLKELNENVKAVADRAIDIHEELKLLQVEPELQQEAIMRLETQVYSFKRFYNIMNSIFQQEYGVDEVLYQEEKNLEFAINEMSTELGFLEEDNNSQDYELKNAAYLQMLNRRAEIHHIYQTQYPEYWQQRQYFYEYQTAK